MKEESVVKATGRPLSEWYGLIDKSGLADASHKMIAEHLAGFPEVSFWWAQTLTVEYEKHIGRRVMGQTSDGRFQVGVSKTLAVPSTVIWDFLESPDGIALILGGDNGEPAVERHTDGLEHLQAEAGRSGFSAEVTTYRHGSHLRMRFTAADWEEPSILQVRLEAGSDGKTSITFHHEKLPGPEAREQMRSRWRGIAAALADRLAV